MILTNNDKLISYLDLNLFKHLLEADQDTFDNSVNPHGLATGFIDFKKKDVTYFGDKIIEVIEHVMNDNLKTKSIDLFVLQIYEDRKVKKTYYIKPQDFVLPLNNPSSNYKTYTKRAENGEFPELSFGS